MPGQQLACEARASDAPDLAAAFAAFDRANAADPNLEEGAEGPEPKELLYGRRMSAFLTELHPEASAELRLAARAQHLERWRIPRKSYPEGRVGYLTWRRDLKAFHADRAAEILRDLGFEEAFIARVGALLRKERLKQDPDSQALEDVACLVFLAHHFAAFSEGHDEAKLVDILRKTWRKMSERGQQAALALPLDGRSLRLVETALAG
ncbi:MAG: DUF4202 domain-containing protein [Kiloniellales bacterium]|nr:DUF4202 domain-containing protein [Kiloniellales bacterium]MDJ0969377.1 DUF4202 domain-containing protein [Kiloniellales bacterium]MDJ0981400.1 DUF4202 domain-containing protein [Kiloniellales bacterium]